MSLTAGACGTFTAIEAWGSAGVSARDGTVEAVAGFGTDTFAGKAEAMDTAIGGREATLVATGVGLSGVGGAGGLSPCDCGEENRLGEPSQPGRLLAPSSLSNKAATSGSMVVTWRPRKRLSATDIEDPIQIIPSDPAIAASGSRSLASCKHL